ncbi:hypothetical protein EII25_06215 [Erysipelotrichaceae bacterium OH741_COT-311]|nr:hypothetical protein EII25_06215 [Erysipelotrichaceae bacterium OH741_COT-311]
MTYIYAIVFVGILAMFYALGYYLNHKTPLPKECQDLKLECEGCNITSCEVHPVHDIKEEE